MVTHACYWFEQHCMHTLCDHPVYIAMPAADQSNKMSTQRSEMS